MKHLSSGVVEDDMRLTIEKSFYSRPSNARDLPQDQLDRMEDLRDLFAACAREVSNTPEGRHRSLSLTKLEEAAMLATKAITHWDMELWE